MTNEARHDGDDQAPEASGGPPAYFEAPAGDDTQCPCGNEVCGGEGFCFAHQDGTPHSLDAPPRGWQNHQTMACPQCGRFFRQTEHDERGYPVAGVRPRT
ncbi:hypothetical protein [Pseudonocardia sp. NPDC049635]|uniref:hypothetical protein n=1 Tax=Pseudonocardia sp. NPDC049635 TaxID=3155506 RepID=UPI0033F95DBD